MIDVQTYLKAKKIMKFNSRYTQNKPAQVNLLELSKNAMNTLNLKGSK
jgi:hypothetical protein